MAARPPNRKTIKVCKDCKLEGITTKRDAKYPGPRCYTHHLKFKRRSRASRQESYVFETYNITEEQYQAIYKAQGGRCFICQRATGKQRRLAVDHDHSCCPGRTSCGKCVRGLLCRKCNRDVLGHLRDEPEALERGAAYLRNPPAKEVLTAWNA